MLCLNEPQYKELTLEFSSTFQYKDGNFDQQDAITFALGRKTYEMDMFEFGVASGFFSVAEVQLPEFKTILRGAFTKQRPLSFTNTQLARFWEKIAISLFSGCMVSSDIRDPVLRYIHCILVNTLIGRGSGENKVNWLDWFCSLVMMEKVSVNYASILACSFHRARRGGTK